jgi:hypothetical protein
MKNDLSFLRHRGSVQCLLMRMLVNLVISAIGQTEVTRRFVLGYASYGAGNRKSATEEWRVASAEAHLPH